MRTASKALDKMLKIGDFKWYYKCIHCTSVWQMLLTWTERCLWPGRVIWYNFSTFYRLFITLVNESDRILENLGIFHFAREGKGVILGSMVCHNLSFSSSTSWVVSFFLAERKCTSAFFSFSLNGKLPIVHGNVKVRKERVCQSKSGSWKLNEPNDTSVERVDSGVS
jgi:hypothetical protein